MRRIAFLAPAALLLVSCAGRQSKPRDFTALTDEFVRYTLAHSPVAATAAGYHEHSGASLDERLDDWSLAGVAGRRAHWRSWLDRLGNIDTRDLGPEERADLGLMKNICESALFELDVEQGWRRNPVFYVELVGNALFTPYAVEYAPPEQRWRHIAARLEAVPALVEVARGNLESSTAVWTQTAIQENEGTISLIEKELVPKAPEPLAGRIRPAAARAVESLRSFNAHIAALKDAGPDSWRLGPEKYARKFRLVFGPDADPEKLLKEAEQALTEIRREMFKAASPLHGKYFPHHRDPVDLNLIVREVLGKVAEKRPAREKYFDEAQKYLEEIREFVKNNGERIVPLPPSANLKIIETPPFMRGVYAVGGFNPAPPLQPELGAFYWLTPIPPDWPRERAESWLREYNFYGLRLLTMHEAVPGHWLQFEYAARVQPAPRRVLRSLFGDGAYVEGWAVYATDLMVREGYLGRSRELELIHYKQLLRAIANAILDIRLHTKGMTEEEALDLMMNRTFQEKEEAMAKLRRARLSSCQLPTYFAGFRAWKRLRAAAEVQAGGSFRPGEFHRRALAEGALPAPVLAALLGLDPGGPAAGARANP